MKEVEESILPYEIQNIVSTFTGVVSKLFLRLVCMSLPWCQFNPEVFAALIGRLDDPKTTILTFSSANNVCTGAKSEIESRIACRIMAATMQENGIECSVGNFVIQNIVTSANTGFPLRLEDIVVKYYPSASYSPETFPGLIFRMTNPKIVFLLFKQGKLVITGGKKRSIITKAINLFYNEILLHFRDYNETINYVQQPQETPANLVDVIVKIFEKFANEDETDQFMTERVII